MAQILGIDLGGTKIAGGLVDLGKLKNWATVATQADKGKSVVLKNLADLIRRLLDPKIKKIGIAVAGQVDCKSGVVHNTPNIPGFKNFKLVDWLKKEFPGRQFRIDNDAHCFVLAESIFGAGKGYKNVVGLTLGTGIGGGIMIDGQLYRGANNSAGEFGHMQIAGPKTRCSCGQSGHLEALASGRAIEKSYFQLTKQKLKAHEIENLALTDAGDRQAKKVYSLAAASLAVGLSNILNSLDPEVIILGGGLTKRNKSLVTLSLQNLKKLLLYKSLEKTKVFTAKLGQEAGIIGASLLF